jgi:hypothetical protein
MDTAGNPFTEVERWIGKHGVPSRALFGQSRIVDALRILVDLGCGAWVGRTACGQPATAILEGTAWLHFNAYRAIHGDSVPVFVAVCDRHAESRKALIADMDRRIRKSHHEEYVRFRRKVGGEHNQGVIVYPIETLEEE